MDVSPNPTALAFYRTSFVKSTLMDVSPNPTALAFYRTSLVNSILNEHRNYRQYRCKY